VEQVFYVEDEKNPDWACAMRTKPKNVYDISQGQGSYDDKVNYHESEPLLLDRNHHYDPYDDLEYVIIDLAPVEACVIP
jgi:hypothetical protein